MIAWLWNVCGEGVSCPYVNKGPKQRLCVSLSQSKKKVSYLRVQPCFGIDSCSGRAAGSTERWAAFSRTQRSTRSSLQGLIQTSLVYASLYLGLISVNRVFMRCYKFHFQKRVSMEAHVRLPCGFHRPPRSLCILAVCHGKISETNKSLGRHPSVLKNTSESCGLWWEGVAQRWRNYLFTLALSENKKKNKKKGIISSPKWKANKQVFLSRQRGQERAACGRAAACWTRHEKEGDTLRFFPTTSSPPSSLPSSLSLRFCREGGRHESSFRGVQCRIRLTVEKHMITITYRRGIRIIYSLTDFFLYHY